MVHHAIALGLHVTMLILLKRALDARGSKLMPDKIAFSYGFTCDSFYLATLSCINIYLDWYLTIITGYFMH